MVEGGGVGFAVNRGRLRLQAGELALEIGHQQVGHVVPEALPHDHAQRREVRPVFRERVGGQLPAAFPHRVRDVEHRVVVDPVLECEREDRKLVSLRYQLERAQLGDPRRQARGDVARVPLHPPVSVEPEAQQVVVLRDDLGPGREKLSAKVGMLSPR